MNAPQDAVLSNGATESLTARFRRVRGRTLALCEHLATEDYVVQSMPDVSPTKWHLAHITWFFERFVLVPNVAGYRCFNDDFDFLFNSYYYTAGQMHARPRRGLLTRPTVSEVIEFRAHVDDAIADYLDTGPPDDALQVIELGIHHEQQHQELLLTDIKHVMSCNPLEPAANPTLPVPASEVPPPMRFAEGPSGIQEIGASGGGFCFDNETPRHASLVQPHRIGSRLVTSGEYLEFIRDGGYAEPSLWLSDGWSTANEQGWNRPLYWSEDLDTEFTLAGRRPLDHNAPVTHVSYYEADAYARWSGARLPTEAEWEIAARSQDVDGNFVEAGFWHPVAGSGPQYFGDVWEWTSSPYAPYPGFVPLAGSLGEYNGKFMCNQMTVRGGSCATAIDHIRASYRSFFYPDARWQFLGIRLARDGNEQ